MNADKNKKQRRNSFFDFGLICVHQRKSAAILLLLRVSVVDIPQ